MRYCHRKRVRGGYLWAHSSTPDERIYQFKWESDVLEFGGLDRKLNGIGIQPRGMEADEVPRVRN